jgi:hypothetical protein
VEVIDKVIKIIEYIINYFTKKSRQEIKEQLDKQFSEAENKKDLSDLNRRISK